MIITHLFPHTNCHYFKQKLWGEEGYMASDSIDHPYGSDELKKSERLKWMAQNSGMEFAANPSEFDSRVIYIYIYIYMNYFYYFIISYMFQF